MKTLEYESCENTKQITVRRDQTHIFQFAQLADSNTCAFVNTLKTPFDTMGFC